MQSQRFEGTDTYVATQDLKVAVNAAIALERPLLIKGEPGTGKTILAHEVAKALGQALITWHIKSTTKAQQGLYEYDAVSRLRDGQLGDERVHDIANYIKPGKLWEAFEADAAPVLLIDEIDKADIEFPNDLLLELDRMEFYVYETRKTIVARQRPIVMITSNNEKELPDAFLRRCFFHYIRFPDRETMQRIVDVHFPGLKRDLVHEALTIFFDIREVPGLKKKPSTSELLDWLKLLLVEDISPEALRTRDPKKLIPPLHGALLKNEQDVHLFERLAFLNRREQPMRGSPQPSPHCGRGCRLSGATSDRLVMPSPTVRDRDVADSSRRFGERISCSSSFFLELRAAQGAGLQLARVPDADGGDARRASRGFDIDEFYFLARTALVKDERHLDRFDRVFGHCFKGLETPDRPADRDARGVAAQARRAASDRGGEKAGRGARRLGQADGDTAPAARRAEGRGTRAATNGSAPPAPRRSAPTATTPKGCASAARRARKAATARAVKVWDKREFRNLDDTVELGTRNIKLALRRLRQFAREGAELELDLPGTIRSTAHNAGWLDLKMVPERHNAVKLLLFLDVGGSMDDHIRICEELFSAARGEFKHLVHFYFHNCLYDTVWKDSRRRHVEQTPVMELLRTYDPGHKVVLVGDASMSPYEIDREGGSVERWNDEPARGLDAAAAGHLSEGGMAQPGAGEILGRHRPASA